MIKKNDSFLFTLSRFPLMILHWSILKLPVETTPRCAFAPSITIFYFTPQFRISPQRSLVSQFTRAASIAPHFVNTPNSPPICKRCSNRLRSINPHSSALENSSTSRRNVTRYSPAQLTSSSKALLGVCWVSTFAGTDMTNVSSPRNTVRKRVCEMPHAFVDFVDKVPRFERNTPRYYPSVRYNDTLRNEMVLRTDAARSTTVKIIVRDELQPHGTKQTWTDAWL